MITLLTFTIQLNTGKPLRYVLFETQADINTGKTTVMGSITEECQKKVSFFAW